METFDYVIIGAGSAGSVLTNRLSEDAGTRVCVLEAGPSDWHPYIHLPAGFIKTFHMKSVNWAYQQEPGPYTGGRSIYAPRGKTLGGSSSINGHIYNRGQRQDFDTWAQLGNRGWGYPDVLPYFRRMERRIGEGDDTYRGRDGNLTVTTMDWQDPLCEAFMAGAVSLGIPRNPDYNGQIQEGVSYCQRTILNGRRVSAATAFLHPARRRPNVDVRTHAHVTGIIFEGKRAVGVRYNRGGKHGDPLEIRATKEVILSGGAYNSPQLLQLSGVGSPALLQSHGIEVEPYAFFVAKSIALAGAVLYFTYLIASHRGLPNVLVIMTVLIAAYGFVTRRTVIGRQIYAVGGNAKAAKLSGVKTERLTFFTFVNMGVLAALAGLVFAARLNTATPKAGLGFELDVIAACFIGGASAYGGVGRVGGAVVGAMIMGVMNNGMSILGIGIDYQQVIKGLVLLGAVCIDVYNQRR